MKLLLVEDEVRLAEALAQILKNNGFEVDYALDGESGLQSALRSNYDLLLLDVMLPKMNGFDVLKAIRAQNKTMPILLLTAKTEVCDKVMGLDYGANDYISKPFNTDELLARVRSHLRTSSVTGFENQLKYGDIVLYSSTHKLASRKGNIKLTAKEEELFDYLLKNNSVVIPFEKIAEKLELEGENAVQEKTSAYIAILSNKLAHIKSTVKILTIHGIGYKLVSPQQDDLWAKTAKRSEDNFALEAMKII